MACNEFSVTYTDIQDLHIVLEFTYGFLDVFCL